MPGRRKRDLRSTIAIRRFWRRLRVDPARTEGMAMIYRNRNYYIWSTALFAARLPRILDPFWRRLAYRPRVLRNSRR